MIPTAQTMETDNETKVRPAAGRPCGQFTLPAEWCEQDGVQLTWPHARTDWHDYLDEITDTYLQLTRVIAERETVIIATPEPEAVRQLISQHLPAPLMKNIRIFACESNDTWARDHGAITLTGNDHDANGQYRLLDFHFNGWGEKFEAALDNTITRQLYEQGAFNGELEDHDDFVLEGGSIESDGQGTIFTTSTCLLAPHRNQPMDRAEIEQQLKQRLGMEHVVWIDHGELEGDDTDGHIDTLVRPAPHHTLVYCGPGEPSDNQYTSLNNMRKQLQDLRTPEGKPYRLVELPLPAPLHYDGERLPATYANYLILNGAIVLPTYGQPENDKDAAEKLREAFPHHDIISLDARIIVRQHGSIHCITMQYPKGSLTQSKQS